MALFWDGHLDHYRSAICHGGIGYRDYSCSDSIVNRLQLATHYRIGYSLHKILQLILYGLHSYLDVHSDPKYSGCHCRHLLLSTTFFTHTYIQFCSWISFIPAVYVLGHPPAALCTHSNQRMLVLFFFFLLGDINLASSSECG